MNINLALHLITNIGTDPNNHKEFNLIADFNTCEDMLNIII
jgi:hypothetical protein